jgi:hypothetical protein
MSNIFSDYYVSIFDSSIIEVDVLKIANNSLYKYPQFELKHNLKNFNVVFHNAFNLSGG